MSLFPKMVHHKVHLVNGSKGASGWCIMIGKDHMAVGPKRAPKKNLLVKGEVNKSCGPQGFSY